jgi:hypothetical protein
MWAAVGKARQMPEVAAHGASLLAIAPKMRAAIQASIAKTSFTITEEGPRKGKTCVRTGAGKDSPSGQPNLPTASSSCTDGGGRSYPEMFYSGVLTAQQVDDIYETVTTSNNSKYGTRPMTMGAAGAHQPTCLPSGGRGTYPAAAAYLSVWRTLRGFLSPPSDRLCLIGSV